MRLLGCAALIAPVLLASAAAAQAPFSDADVQVHVVQRKRFPDSGRHELVLYPAVVQTNIKFTEHVGTAVSYVYHLNENIGLQLTPQYNWYLNESAFNRELIVKVREEAEPAASLLLAWSVHGGVEVTPLYGKLAFLDGLIAQFTVVLNGGIGLGSTMHQLRPALGGNPATYGDTGVKLLGAFGGGLRVQIGDRFALRIELRDLFYGARVDHVNGCTAAELSAMSALVNEGETSLSGKVAVGPYCRIDRFSGIDPRTGESRALDAPVARGLVETPSTAVLNNVGLYAGFAYLF